MPNFLRQNALLPSSRTASALFIALASFALSSCTPPPDPIYDDDLNLQAVAVEKGSLAGLWGVKTNSLGIAVLPLIGEQFTGGNTYLLLDRTWDAASEKYTEVYKMCGGNIFDTDASTSFIENFVWRLAEVFPPASVEFDHDLGTYELETYLEIWGIKDLPDPLNTPFPLDGADAKNEPHASRIFDLEGDGHQGATMAVAGAIDADVYFIQRRTSDFHGLILSTDEIVGLMDWEKTQITLDASNLLLNGNLEQAHHPDPKEHWFHQVRLSDNADCEDVLAAVEDELLSRLQPF